MRTRESRSPRPHAALCGRAARHPMMILATVACVCLVSFAFGSLLSSLARNMPDADVVHTTDKGARIVPKSPIDSACRGQNWGHESRECLDAILNRTQSGHRRQVRIIADAGSDTEDP